MTDMNVQITKIAHGSPAQQGSGATADTSANFAGVGNFWDIILSRLVSGEGEPSIQQASVQTGTDKNAAKTADKVSKSGKEANPLALLQIALSGQTLDANGNIVLPEDTASLEESLQKQLALTDTIINHLKNALPENPDNKGLFNQILSKLQTKSDTLQASIAALESGMISKDMPVEDIPMPLLIAFGLNPAEIAAVAEHVQALEEKLGRDVTVEDLIAGVGELLAPAPETVATAVPTVTMPKQETAAQAAHKAADAVVADIGSNNGSDEKPVLPKTAQPFLPDAVEERPLTASEKLAARDLLMQGAGKQDAPVAAGSVKQETAALKENLSLPAPQTPTLSQDDNALSLPFSSFVAESDTMWSQLGLATGAATTLGTVAQAANMASSHAHAGQPHPATQLVSATLTKAGKEGASDTIQIQLDPPELGSVNIRLQVGKDKSVKAHIVVEKPETYLMLQRDGLTLERALQSAGLDANGESVSFELAQDGGSLNLGNNGEGGGEKNLGGRGSSEETDETILQTTMTWQVDESTGHVRYNIFA